MANWLVHQLIKVKKKKSSLKNLTLSVESHIIQESYIVHPALKLFSASAGCCALGNNCGRRGNSSDPGKVLTRGAGPSRSTLLILLRARPDCSNHLLGLGKGGTLLAFLRSEQTGKGRLSGSWQIDQKPTVIFEERTHLHELGLQRHRFPPLHCSFQSQVSLAGNQGIWA